MSNIIFSIACIYITIFAGEQRNAETGGKRKNAAKAKPIIYFDRIRSVFMVQAAILERDILRWFAVRHGVSCMPYIALRKRQLQVQESQLSICQHFWFMCGIMQGSQKTEKKGLKILRV